MKMHIWATKYALTSGIQEYKNADGSEHYPNMVSVGGLQTFHGKDWHLTLTQAQQRAEEMRLDKIKSLEKSLKKMRGLTF